MEHVIVAGGSGFIGSHLTKKLLEMDYRVTVLDNFSSGHYQKLREVATYPHLKIINHDITIPIDLNCDYIFNLASRASPKDFQKYPQDILMTNSLGVKNLIELAMHSDAIFLQASTSEVYGDPMLSPQNEEYRGNVSPTGVRSCYDEGKRFAEALLFSYYRSFDLDVRIARIFNTYGPNMNLNDGRVVPNFFKQILNNKSLTIYGDGSQTRSFCYVDDMVNGLITLMFAPKDIAKGEVYNLGNPEPITIKSLAEEILELTKSNVEIMYHPLPPDDPISRCPDISKVRSHLKWEPQIGRSEGLMHTYRYFKNNKNRI